MKKFSLAILVIAVLAGAWFFASPLFINETVDEDFDFVRTDGRIDIENVMAMPVDKRHAIMNEIMDAAAKAPDQRSMEEMAFDAPQVIASGQFVDADVIHKGSGRATLYGLPDGQHVVRFEDFRTTNGPALVVYLAKHQAPTKASDVSNGGFVKLGKLKGNIGNQNYPVPEGTDIAEYNSVVIWCELFGVLFSPAALQRT